MIIHSSWRQGVIQLIYVCLHPSFTYNVVNTWQHLGTMKRVQFSQFQLGHIQRFQISQVKQQTKMPFLKAKQDKKVMQHFPSYPKQM